MEKLRIVVSQIFYPLSMGSYFIKALQRREDVELFLVGPYTGTRIPWNGGMDLPAKYVTVPDFVLPQQTAQMGGIPYELVQNKIPFEPDLWLEIDAGFHMKTKPNAKVVAHVQTDPHCVSGDTIICTNKGFLFASEASTSKIDSVSDKNGISRCGGVLYSGWKTTRKIIVENGYELVCTDDHLVETKQGMVAAGNLRVGDELLLSRGMNELPCGTDQDYSVGFVIGSFQGDGSFGSNDIVKFTIGKERKIEFGEHIIYHLRNGFNIDVVTEGKHYTCENAKVLQVRRWGFHRFLKSLDLKSGHVPFFIRTGTKKLISGYLAGLFAADGCSVNGKVQITTKWENLAKELQIILLHLGSVSRRVLIKSNAGSFKPGQSYYALYVNSGESTKNLFSLTGNIPGRPLKDGYKSSKEDNGSVQYFSVTSIFGAVKNNQTSRICEPVYDVYNTESHTFLASGFSVHNCLKGSYRSHKNIPDINFCMQMPYIEQGEHYLPYAFDPTIFYPEDLEKEYHGCLIGLHYPQRDSLVNRLRRAYNVYYSIGEIFDENRTKYNQSEIALSWSSLLDLPARVWEAFGMGLPLLTNRVPDLSNFFRENEHYMAFGSIDEAEKKFSMLMSDDDMRFEMGNAAYQTVKGVHTWDKRIEEILVKCDLLG